MESPDIRQVETRDIHIHPALNPPRDLHLQDLYEAAYYGRLPVYFAAVPFGLIVPFDDRYDPSKHPAGAAAIDEVFKEWAAGKFKVAWLYEVEGHFILSDDYVIWEAAKRGKPDYIPGYILGPAIHSDLKDVQGPLSIEGVAKALGFAPAVEPRSSAPGQKG